MNSMTAMSAKFQKSMWSSAHLELIKFVAMAIILLTFLRMPIF